MWGFKKYNDNSSKNVIHSEEYERILKRIIEIHTKNEILETKFKLLETDVSNLRGNFNNRLKAIKEREKTEEEKVTETFNKDEYVAFG